MIRLNSLLIVYQHRGKLYGENDLDPKYRNYILNMGSGWSTRIRQHVAARLQ